jgi:hypothetical protein
MVKYPPTPQSTPHTNLRGKDEVRSTKYECLVRLTETFFLLKKQELSDWVFFQQDFRNGLSNEQKK